MRVPVYARERTIPTGTVNAETDISGVSASFRPIVVGGEEMAEHFARVRARMEEEDTANAALNAYTNASRESRQLLLDPEKGIYARRGAQAFGAYEDGQRGLDEIYAKTAATLGNDKQRRAFDVLWKRRQESELDSIARHVAGERRTYSDQTVKALVATSVDDAVANYTNPELVQTALRTSETAIRANTAGLPPEMIDLQIRDARSKIHEGIIARMAVDDPSAAWAYLNEKKGEIEGGAVAKLGATLRAGVTKDVGVRLGEGISRGAVATGEVPLKIAQEARAQGVDPTLAIAVNLIENPAMDPNARPIRGGKTLSSARGHFQITDDTWTSLGGQPGERGDAGRQIELGVKNLKEHTDRLRAKLGREPEPWEVYVAHQQGAGGGPELLTADRSARAAGIVGVTALTNNGVPPDATVGQFLDKWKANYADAAKRVKVPDGKVPVTPIDKGIQADLDLPQQLEAVDQIADPDVRAAARATVIQRHSEKRAASEAQHRALRAQAYQALDAGGGIDAIPATVWGELPLQDRQSIEAFVERRAKGTQKTDPAVYDRLNRMAGDKPEDFANTDLLQYRGDLTEAHWTHFSDLQRTVKAADTRASEKTTSIRNANQMADDALRQMKIDPSPKEGSADAGKAAAFRMRLQQEVSEFEAQKGGKADPTDIQKIVDRLSIRVAVPDTGYFGTNVGRTEKRLFELPAGQKGEVDEISDIPATALAQARAVFAKRGKKGEDKDIVAFVNAYVQGDRAAMNAALEAAK